MRSQPQINRPDRRQVFSEDIYTALRADRAFKGKPEGAGDEAARAVAESLSMALWRAAQRDAEADAADRAVDTSLAQWRATKRAEAAKADTIAKLADELLELLPGRITDYIEWPSAAVDARRMLIRLAAEARQRAAQTRAQTRQSPGPKVDPWRITLTKWVAAQFACYGLMPRMSKDGTFQIVVAIVQAAAGFPHRSDSDNVTRDVMAVLRDPATKALIVQVWESKLTEVAT